MSELLIEIGCEELPASVQERASSALLEFLESKLRSKGFRTGKGKSFATPTRLAAILEISPVSDVLEEEKVGPPVHVAYDSQGNPTLALKKFVESSNAKLEDVYIKESGRGRYVAVKIKKGGKHLKDVLGDVLEEYVKTVPLPKRMRWDNSGLTFIRPIRWLVAMLDDEVLPVTLGRLKAGRTTYTGRLPFRKKVDIPKASLYEDVLESHDVIVDFKKRLKRIREETERFFKIDKELYEEYETDVESLIQEITGLVEKGWAVYGRYDPQYLKSLYPEVVMTAMIAHQRYIPHLEREGLKPGFVAFSNNPKGLDTHRKGYERVLKARLNDALFYKEEDLKLPLSYYVENLRNITWIEGLGTLYDRMERVKSLVSRMPKPADLDSDILNFVSTHYLFDMATSMIKDGKEFVKLEGKIGYYYAKEKLRPTLGDEAERYALGIYEAKLPKGKKFPKTLEGTSVALADALNTVDGLLSIGYSWTSSRDPLGIRGQMRRFLALLFYSDFGRYDLESFLSLTQTYEGKKDVWKELISDLLVNALTWVQDTFAYAYYPEDPNSIRLTYDGRNVFLSAIKARAYEKIVKGENNEKFLTIVKRLRRIFRSKPKRFLKDEAPSSKEYEKKLLKVLEDMEGSALKEIRSIDVERDRAEDILSAYENYISSLLVLYDALDDFFNNVPVMVEREEDRNRRLGLLRRALSLVEEVVEEV